MSIIRIIKEGSEVGVKKIISIIVFIIMLILLVLAIFGIFFLVDQFKKGNENSVLSLVSYKLEDASELTSKKLHYTGLITYSDGDIPILKQGKFSMIYQAEVRAGIDFSKLNIIITKDKVFIKIPKANIQSIDIDTSKLKFYDEQFAFFNTDQKEDLKKAIEAAKKDLENSTLLNDLVKEADKSAKILLKRILEGSVGPREVVIETIEEK